MAIKLKKLKYWENENTTLGASVCFDHTDVKLIMIPILSVVRSLLIDWELYLKQLQVHLRDMHDTSWFYSSNKFTYIRRYDLMP